MSAIESREAWDRYRERELSSVRPILTELGFELDDVQVHIGGERYLMVGHTLYLSGGRTRQGSVRKLVLMGRRIHDNKRVVIKVSSDPSGAREIKHEREARQLLHKINFAQRAFFSPAEVLFMERDGRVISIVEYVEQERHFIDHPLDEQFFLALRALEAQEGAHATTARHAATIEEVFGIARADEYLRAFSTFKDTALTYNSDNTSLREALERARDFLQKNRTVIERYSGFLTHHDFFPHNLRINGRDIYLLDYAAIYFGNKYESWARFLNYMLQFSPLLEKALAQYVRDNRGEEEYLCLRLLRAYKIGFLLQFYAASLPKTHGDLHKMAQLRIAFWTNALNAIVDDQPLPEGAVGEFIRAQEALRSEEEKARQREVSSSQGVVA